MIPQTITPATLLTPDEFELLSHARRAVYLQTLTNRQLLIQASLHAQRTSMSPQLILLSWQVMGFFSLDHYRATANLLACEVQP